MYKKLIFSVLTASLILSGTSASVWAQEEAGSLPRSLEEVEDSTILNMEDLLEKVEAAGCNTIEHYGDGSVYSWYCYYSEDTCVMENSEGYIEMLSKDINCVYDPGTDTPSRLLFLSEEGKEEYKNGMYDYSSYMFDGEDMVSITEEAEGIRLVTQLDDASAADYLDSMGYEYQEGDIVQWNYEINPEIRAIVSANAVCISEDGTETTIFERTLNLEPEKYALSSEILDRLNAEESRTVTVVVNPGTEQEYSVSETVGKGCSVSTYTGDAVLYTDESCTEEYIPTGDTENDFTLYTTIEE